jgi:hypothetical protein
MILQNACITTCLQSRSTFGTGRRFRGDLPNLNAIRSISFYTLRIEKYCALPYGGRRWGDVHLNPSSALFEAFFRSFKNQTSILMIQYFFADAWHAGANFSLGVCSEIVGDILPSCRPISGRSKSGITRSYAALNESHSFSTRFTRYTVNYPCCHMRCAGENEDNEESRVS